MKISFPQSIRYANLPTPVFRLKSRWSEKSEVSIWIKRDDLTGLEISGNKARKLEFLLNDAIHQKSTHIITCGSFQSNHCRTTAFMATTLGMKPVLFLKGVPGAEIPDGNFMLDKLLQADIVPVSARDYEQIDSVMSERAADLKVQGKKGYCIPEGGSNCLGIWGYIQCFTEIVAQIQEQSLPIDTVVVATGSGGTHAGLQLGKMMLDSPLQILSINVCDNADICRRKIMTLIGDFNEFYGYNFSCSVEEIKVFDGFVGSGYGLLNQPEIGLIKEFARREGIILDPVYTVKAFLGLRTLLDTGSIPCQNILFVHTGGIFSIFPYAAELLQQ
jgi:D-cysteine desulfhydrase